MFVWKFVNRRFTLEFFIVVIFLFFLTIFTSKTQVLFPTTKDSIIANRNVEFSFDNSAYTIHSLRGKMDNEIWFWIFRDWTKPKFVWTPPIKDADSVHFSYFGLKFIPPKKVVYFPKTHRLEVTDVDFSSTGRFFVSSGQEGKIYIWNFESKAIIDSLVFDSKILSVRFWRNDNEIVFSSDSSLFVWHRDKKLVGKIASTNGLVRAIDVGKNKLLAYGSYDGTFAILDSNLHQLFTFRNSSEIYSVTFSSESQKVGFGDYSGKATIFELSDLRNPTVFNTLETDNVRNVIWALSIVDSENLVAAGGIDGKIRVWDYRTAELIDTVQLHSFHVRKAFLSTKDLVLTSGSLDKALHFYHIQTKEEITTPIIFDSGIISLKFSPDEKYFVVGLRDGSISIWENYKVEFISQNFSLPYFIPMKLRLSSFSVKPNEVKVVPVIVDNVLDAKLERFFSDTSFLVLKIPYGLIGVRQVGFEKFSLLEHYIVYSNLPDIALSDTFAVLYFWGLTPRLGWEKISVKEVVFRGKRNLLWLVPDDSVQVTEDCKSLISLNQFELIDGNSIELYPNPASQKLTIKIFGNVGESYTVKIQDLMGKTIRVIKQDVFSSKFEELVCDVSNIGNGEYFVVLKTGAKSLAKKLIILH